MNYSNLLIHFFAIDYKKLYCRLMNSVDLISIYFFTQDETIIMASVVDLFASTYISYSVLIKSSIILILLGFQTVQFHQPD